MLNYRSAINNRAAPLSAVLKHTAADVSTLRGSYTLRLFSTCWVTRFCSVPFHTSAEAEAGPEERASILSFRELSELMQALPGFLMLLTGEGKLLYLSDSVSEHLGHSMVSLHATPFLVWCSMNMYPSSPLGFVNYVSVCNGVFFLLQVDLVAQGDSVYDIIDASDHFVMRSNLSTSSSLEMGETNITCTSWNLFSPPNAD